MSSAVISPCGSYRYELRRRIPCVLRWVRPLVIMGLNPSTADAQTDDNTIRREIAFATKWQCTELIKVNVFGLRNKDPRALKGHTDPVGPENDKYIDAALSLAGSGAKILMAFGANKLARRRAIEIVSRHRDIQMWALDINADGSPKHPLYVDSLNEPIPWPAQARWANVEQAVRERLIKP